MFQSAHWKLDLIFENICDPGSPSSAVPSSHSSPKGDLGLLYHAHQRTQAKVQCERFLQFVREIDLTGTFRIGESPTRESLETMEKHGSLGFLVPNMQGVCWGVGCGSGYLMLGLEYVTLVSWASIFLLGNRAWKISWQKRCRQYYNINLTWTIYLVSSPAPKTNE